MLKKIFYLNPEGMYRPYLEVIFSNPSNSRRFKTLALIDSGADAILLPHTLGLQIGLQHPVGEGLKYIEGIGGNITYLERVCEIALLNSDSKKIFIFEIQVHWAYPDEETRNNLVDLFRSIDALERLINIERNPLIKKNLEIQLQNDKREIERLLSIYETGVLLGRSFFPNFEWIQFCHKDTPNRCRFIYKIRESKIDRIVDL